MIVVSGPISPRASACSSMCRAGRALTDQPGFIDSSLTTTSGVSSAARPWKQLIWLVRPLKLRTGVEPSISSMLPKGLKLPSRIFEGLTHSPKREGFSLYATLVCRRTALAAVLIVFLSISPRFPCYPDDVDAEHRGDAADEMIQLDDLTSSKMLRTETEIDAK